MPGISLRNDKIIVALADKVSSELGSAVVAPDALSPRLRQDCEKLAELCHGYRPYSPYHPLFDAAEFERLRASDSTVAGIYAARQVAEKRAALHRQEEELRKKLGQQTS